ncbi:MAG: hypothetical protein FWC45_00875 [Treponema sp.]|nr:hypothetical protein [Treponema sp.]
MKRVLFSIIFACLVFPAFSQNANTQRYKALGDTINSTLSGSNSKLQSFDQLVNDSGNTKTYASFRDRYDTISKALQQSEARLNRLIQTNDRTANVKAERDNYESLVKKLEALKSDYDNWIKNVK